MVKGLKNGYSMHFSSWPSSLHGRVCYYWQCSFSLSQVFSFVIEDRVFFAKMCFYSFMIINQSQMYTYEEKKHKSPDRKGRPTGPNRLLFLTLFQQEVRGFKPIFKFFCIILEAIWQYNSQC